MQTSSQKLSPSYFLYQYLVLLTCSRVLLIDTIDTIIYAADVLLVTRKTIQSGRFTCWMKRLSRTDRVTHRVSVPDASRLEGHYH